AFTGVALVRSPTARNAAAFGVVAALATLSKPIVLLLPFVFLPLAGLSWRRHQVTAPQALRAIAVCLACFIVPLVPWCIRNYVVTDGRFSSVSSNGPGEFLRGYINAQPKYYLLRQDFGGNDPTTTKWDPEANAFEDAILKQHG